MQYREGEYTQIYTYTISLYHYIIEYTHCMYILPASGLVCSPFSAISIASYGIHSGRMRWERERKREKRERRGRE
jgi:hypothetical protein